MIKEGIYVSINRFLFNQEGKDFMMEGEGEGKDSIAETIMMAEVKYNNCFRITFGLVLRYNKKLKVGNLCDCLVNF